eukprot:3731364-Rhodomonas_salina.4
MEAPPLVQTSRLIMEAVPPKMEVVAPILEAVPPKMEAGPARMDDIFHSCWPCFHFGGNLSGIIQRCNWRRWEDARREGGLLGEGGEGCG